MTFLDLFPSWEKAWLNNQISIKKEKEKRSSETFQTDVFFEHVRWPIFENEVFIQSGARGYLGYIFI